MNVILRTKMGLYQALKTLALAGVVGVFALGSSAGYANGSNGDNGNSGNNGSGDNENEDDNGIGHGGGNDGIKVYGANFAGVPGLVAPSLPAFGTKITAVFTNSGSSRTLSVTGRTPSSVFLTPSQTYGIMGTGYSLTANFNGSGSFTSGSVSVSGKFNGSNSNTLLMTANLTSFAKNSDGSMWGFNTNNIWCNAAINAAAKGCTTAEVVYLSLYSEQKSLNKSWKTNGVALTSVPVPAAAWLFGSGLLGLVSVARRKS